MKRKLRYFCTLLLMAVVSVAWAETGTITFSGNGVKINSANVTGDDNLGNTWTITTEGTTSFTSNTAYYQVGSGSKPASSITFTTTLSEDVNIESMSAKFGGFSGTAGTITLKVGETEIGSGSLNATDDVTINSTSTAVGKVLTVTVTGISKGVKVYNISYTYAAASSATPSIAASDVNIASDATEGEIVYTINNPATGGSLTADTDSEWLLLDDNFESPIAFLCDANNGAERTATVTLTYTYGNNETVTEDVTVTQAAYVASVSGYVIDFENEASQYTDWTFTNMESKQTGNGNVTAHGGTYYGTTGGKATASITTKTKIATPYTLTCYVTKQSNNTTASNWKIEVSSDGKNWTTVETQSATSMTAGTWVELSANLTSYTDVYVRVSYGSSTAVRNIDDLTLITEIPTTPILNAENPAELAYDATAGAIDYTITNPVTGGSLSANVTTGDWLTIGTIGESSVQFTCEANATKNARTATVTLTYTYDNETVTKDVTVTQAAAPVIYTTIPELFAAATSTATNVTITFNNWVISAVKGNNAYLTDNQGNGLIIYQNGHGLNVNDVLSGTASCNLVTYHGSAELTGLTATTEGLTVTPNGTVTEQSIAIADLTGVNTGALLHYDGLTYDGTNLVDGNNNSIKPYSTLYEYAFEEGKTYNVTGIYLQYDTTKEILPRDANDIEEVIKPTIIVDPSEVNVGYEGGNGTLTLTYENFEVTGASDFSVVSCHEDGSVFTMFGDGDMSSWLTATVRATGTSYEVAYTVTENTEATARTGYFKVVAGDKGSIGSNVVTVTQAAAPQPYTLSVESLANTGMFVFVENDNEVALDGEGSIDVYEGKTVMLSVDPEQGYALQSLMVDGVDVTSEIDNTGMYTFTMPNHAVTVTATAVKMLSQEGNYVKVTSTADITDGEYLIVYEDGSLAFDGGLQTLDVSGNTIDVTITPGNIIASTQEIDAATFTIESIEGGGYSIKSKSGYYIGRTANSNGLNSSTTEVYVNTIGIDDNYNAVITSSGGPILRFNSASNQNRFRYYGSGQQAIQLYKKIAANTVTVTIKANFPATTFSCDKALDFTGVEGITAYIITDAEGTTQQVTEVPASTGLYIAGQPGSYEIPIIESTEANVSANKLVATAALPSGGIVSDKNVTYYAYGQQDGKEAFFKVSQTTAYTPSANKAVLAILTPANVAPAMIMVNGGGTTAIDNLQLTIYNSDGDIFDLQGRKVQNIQKGIYIVNGRKVVIR